MEAGQRLSAFLKLPEAVVAGHMHAPGDQSASVRINALQMSVLLATRQTGQTWVTMMKRLQLALILVAAFQALQVRCICMHPA